MNPETPRTKCWSLKHRLMEKCWFLRHESKLETMVSKKHGMKTFEWIIFSNPLKARGPHTLGVPSGAPNSSQYLKAKMLVSKAWRWRPLNGLLLKSTQSSGATPIGCTFGAPNRFIMAWSQMLSSKAKGWTPLNGLLLKSTQNSGATPNGCTFGAPNRFTIL